MKTKFFTFLLFIAFNYCHSQDSLNMTLLYQWDPDTLPTAGSNGYNDCWGYVDCNGGEYAIIGSSAMVHFFEISDPANATEVANFAGGQTTTWRDIKTYQDHAYSVCDGCSEGMMIFDLSNLPDSVSQVDHTTEFFTRSHNLFIDEANGRLYAVGTNTTVNGVVVLDISENPGQPTLLANLPLPGGYIHDLYVRNNIAYMNHGNSGLYVYDLTDLDNPITLGSLTDYQQSGYNHSSWLTDDGNHVVFIDETHNTSIKIADVSDPSDIEVVNLFRSSLLAPNDTASIAHNPLIRGDLAFISYYHDGIQVFDISNPESVEKVAYYDTHLQNNNYNGFRGNWGVYPFLPSGTIIVSDMRHGLHLFSMQDIDLQETTFKEFPESEISISGEQRICELESLEVSTSSEAESYHWYHGDTILSNETSVSFTEAGTYYLETRNGHCKTESNDLILDVTPLPDVNLMAESDLQFCEGGSVVINAPAGADIYEWVLGDDIIATDTNSITANLEGAYTLTAANIDCYTSSEPIEVDVVEYPEADYYLSGEGFCPGDSVVIIAWEGVSNYTWYKDAQVISADGNILVVKEPGVYSVLLDTLGCQTQSTDIPVAMYEPSVPDVVFDDNFLTASFSLSYQWFFNDEPISDANEQVYEITEDGFYSVLVTDLNGCMAFSEEMNFIFSQTVDFENLKEVKVFPNPVSDLLNLELNSEQYSQFNIQILNIEGKVLSNRLESFSGNKLFQMNLSAVPSGIYILNIQDGNEQISKKIYKK